MRKVVIFCGVMILIAFSVIRFVHVHFDVDMSGYRHWRVAQTKLVAGTPMTIDDIWWTQTSGDHQAFLRILCHWKNGFPPKDYNMRVSLLKGTDGAEVQGLPTWYVPLPKTSFTPAGVTPFLWEFRTAPPTGKNVGFRVHYASDHLIQANGTIKSAGPVGYVDFEVPNVATERDMSCPDIFAPKPLFWARSRY